jgi:hypothetical protein
LLGLYRQGHARLDVPFRFLLIANPVYLSNFALIERDVVSYFNSRFFKLSLLCSAFHHFPVVYFCLRGGIVKIRRVSDGTVSGVT